MWGRKKPEPVIHDEVQAAACHEAKVIKGIASLDPEKLCPECHFPISRYLSKCWPCWNHHHIIKGSNPVCSGRAHGFYSQDVNEFPKTIDGRYCKSCKELYDPTPAATPKELSEMRKGLESILKDHK